MNKIKKHIKEYLLLALIVTVGVIIHYIAGNFPKRIDSFPDELRYYSIARDIYFHRELYVRGVNTGYQKILYSLVIAPLFMIRDHIIRVKAINFLNCLIMESSAIPLILISKELKLKRKYTYIILVIFCLWPETLITMTFMAETLYWPLVFWFMYFWLINEQKNNVILTVLTSIICYWGYMDKEIFMAFFVTYVLLELWEVVCLLKKSGNIKGHIVKTVVFISVFLLIHIILKSTIFKGLGNSYAQQIGIREVMNLKCIAYIIYAIFYYAVSCVVVLMVAPVSYVVLFAKFFDEKAAKLFRMLSIVLVVAIATIAYTISAREDLFSLCPRLHMRYLAPILVLILLLFFYACQCSDKERIKEQNNKFMLITVAFYLGALLVFRGAMTNSSVDYFSFKWYQMLSSFSENRVMLSIIIVLVMLTITFMIWVNAAQSGKSDYLIVGLVLVMLISDYITYKDVRFCYLISESAENEMQEMSDFTNQKCENDIVYFCDDAGRGLLSVLIDTFIDNKIIFTDSSELERMQMDQLSLTELEYREPYSQIVYDGIDKIEYAILDSQYDRTNIPDSWELIYQNKIFKMFRMN